MKRRHMIYEGKAKILYEGPEPGTLIQYFKDDTTAFDATKKAVLDGKGVLNNRISEYLMTQLNAIGGPTPLLKPLNMREQRVQPGVTIPPACHRRNMPRGPPPNSFWRALPDRAAVAAAAPPASSARHRARCAD